MIPSTEELVQDDLVRYNSVGEGTKLLQDSESMHRLS